MAVILDLVESSLLPHVEKPMRYVGNELNIVRKDLSRVGLHGVLCFPEIYDIGMSHHGGQILYHIVNANPSWALSRCYHPWIDAEEIMRKEGIPLYTLEYLAPVREADWVGFSVQYELQFTNVLNMLDLAGLPVCSRDRGEDAPLVIAGGPCVANPQPLADFVDAFVIGDGEKAIAEICLLLQGTRGQSRAQRLNVLGGVRGVYIPQHDTGRCPGPDPVRAAKLSAIDLPDCPVKPLVPLMDVVHHRLAVEVMRGCTRGCRFCSAGTYYRPVRERDPHDIRRQIESGIAATGWRELGLLSLSTADYSCLRDLLSTARQLRENLKLSVSLPSTRIDALSAHQFAEINEIVGTSSFTIAPEAGSARLRTVINKGFTDEQITDMAKLLLEGGVQTLKLYFMIGLPTETDVDIDAIIETVRRISRLGTAISRRKMIHVSLSPFSPKPHTPFQWEPMDSVDALLSKSKRIKAELSALRNVKVSYRNPWTSFLETVMARGDRALGRTILRAWRDGARLDGWDERFDMDRWLRAAREEGMDLSRYTGGYGPGNPLPWSGVITGVTEEFLLRERERAYAGIPTEDCRTGICGNCGACESGGASMRRASANSEPHPSLTRPPLPKGTGGRFRYRIAYRKGRPLRFLGHHDLIKIIHRAFVAAEVPLEYSQGYKPQPRVSFGPPLPMAVMGAGEYFDVIVTQSSLDIERIGQWLPEGLVLVSARPTSPGVASISESVVAGAYDFEPIAPGDAQETRSRIEIILQSTTIPITEERKGAVVTKDLRPLIQILSPTDGGGFRARLSALPGKTCRPSELVAALFPHSKMADYLVTRIECVLREALVETAEQTPRIP